VACGIQREGDNDEYMRVRSAKFIDIASLAVMALMVCLGCGRSDRSGVSGTLVRQDGSPLASARVVARSNDTGATAYGATDNNGHFKIGDGLAPGDYDVFIAEDLGDPDNRRKPSIASKYGDSATSNIKISVKAGEATQLDLKLDPP
jgi:hypothetical protein